MLNGCHHALPKAHNPTKLKIIGTYLLRGFFKFPGAKMLVPNTTGRIVSALRASTIAPTLRLVVCPRESILSPFFAVATRPIDEESHYWSMPFISLAILSDVTAYPLLKRCNCILGRRYIHSAVRMAVNEEQSIWETCLGRWHFLHGIVGIIIAITIFPCRNKVYHVIDQ